MTPNSSQHPKDLLSVKFYVLRCLSQNEKPKPNCQDETGLGSRLKPDSVKKSLNYYLTGMMS